MEWDVMAVMAVILRWMALLDKNDVQLLQHNDELRRISIDDNP